MSNSSQSATSFSTILFFFPALTFHVFDKLWNSHLKNDGVGWQCVRDIRAKKFSFFLSKGQAWKWFNLIFLFTGTAEINHNKLSIGAMERFFKKDGKIKMLLAFRASLATYLMDWELWQLIISCISKKKKGFCGELLTYFSFSFRLNVSCCCRSVWYVEDFGWVDWHVSLHILNFSIQLMGSSAVNNNRRCLLTQLYFTFSVNLVFVLVPG